MADQPPVFHNRKSAAKYVREKYSQSVSTDFLAKAAVYGGGPAYRKIGGDAIYEEDDLDLWAKGRIGPKIYSTSERGRLGPPAKKGKRRTVDAA